MFQSIAAYSHSLGVHPQTLRRWEREGRAGLTVPVRTPGNHRRYPVQTAGKVTVGYARVSCHDQKDDLPRQIDRLIAQGKSEGREVVIVKDIGSGLNCNKPSLRKLLALLLSGKVRELILTYKDRLLRFGSELVFFICERLGIAVTILDSPKEKSMEETFTQDVLAVLTVFSARLHGARSHRPKAPPLAT
jgi:predicted site-specific integrase-resolvase